MCLNGDIMGGKSRVMFNRHDKGEKKHFEMVGGGGGVVFCLKMFCTYWARPMCRLFMCHLCASSPYPPSLLVYLKHRGRYQSWAPWCWWWNTRNSIPICPYGCGEWVASGYGWVVFSLWFISLSRTHTEWKQSLPVCFWSQKRPDHVPACTLYCIILFECQRSPCSVNSASK